MKKLLCLLLPTLLLSSAIASEVTIGTPTLASPFYNESVSSTPIQVKGSNAVIYGYKIYNPNASPIFVHLYNALSGSVTVGTTTQADFWAVPANGMLFIPKNGAVQGVFSTGLTIAATTTATSAGSTAPTSALIVRIEYQ